MKSYVKKHEFFGAGPSNLAGARISSDITFSVLMKNKLLTTRKKKKSQILICLFPKWCSFRGLSFESIFGSLERKGSRALETYG